jgi:hypothetical protein
MSGRSQRRASMMQETRSANPADQHVLVRQFPRISLSADVADKRRYSEIEAMFIF